MSGAKPDTSKLNIKRIKDSLKDGKRFDGRKPLEHREITIELGVSKNAEGSARVKFGDTEVLAGVKLGVAEPYTDHEEEGTLITTAELMPLSSPRFEYGPPRFNAIELARVVDRGVRESGFIDFKKLCIKKGEKVYQILLDLYSFNDDGNLLDVSCLAAVAALLSAKMPKYDEKTEKIQFGEFTTKSVPTTDSIPLTTTFHKLGDSILVDPSREEEDSSDARVTLALTRNKKMKGIVITAAQKGGEKIFTEKELIDITKNAVDKFKEIESLIKKQIK